MRQFEDVPRLDAPVMIAAFSGWNDAGDAASALVDHLIAEWDAHPVAEIDPEDYYDFQVNRPVVRLVGRERQLDWPGVTIHLARPATADRDVLLVTGPEPSTRWRHFSAELLGFAEECGVERLVLAGALLADTPHTRPIPVSATSEHRTWLEHAEVERSDYEGPSGITGVISVGAGERDLPAVSAWAAVPHYAASTPSPKATLALLRAVERLLGAMLPVADLEEMAQAWQRGVDALAEDDEEITEYVRALEDATDTAELPEASGDAIAREFERYLRGRDDDPRSSGGPSAPGA